MLKTIILMMLSLFILKADTYIILDIAQGVSLKDYNELGKLSIPERKTTKDIYTNKESVYLYSFNETNALAKDFIYYARDKNEKGYKEATKTFYNFFAQVKKYGVKKRDKVGSNIIFLIDTSGSMKKNDVIGDVKDAMRYLINKKSNKSKIAIITFDGKKNMQEKQKTKLLLNFTTSKQKLLDVTQKIHPSPYDTFLGSGLKKVEGLLDGVDVTKSIVLLFTDGKAVDDAQQASQIIQNFKNKGRKLKVVAVGGADINLLKKFSTTGYVFNATSSDLKSIIHGISVGSDEIFLRLNNFFENAPKQPKKGDRIILYSSMMNVDAQNDFYIIPNIASLEFYNEVLQINKHRDAQLNLHGANVYVRVLGKINASKLNNLKIFYKRYFKDANGELRYFSTAPLPKSKLH